MGGVLGKTLSVDERRICLCLSLSIFVLCVLEQRDGAGLSKDVVLQIQGSGGLEFF